MNKKTSKIAICFLATAALAGTAYMFFNTEKTTAGDDDHDHDHEHELFIALTPEQIQDAGIQTETAGPGELQTIIHVPGKIILHSDRVMHLVPKASGIVKETNKNIGDPVGQGEILAVLESHEMAEAKSAYLDSVKKEMQAAANLERETHLHEKRISAEQDYQNAVTEAEQARIDLELTKQKLQTMGMTQPEIDRLADTKNPILRRYDLRSPMNGVVIFKDITKGELLDTNQEVYIVADLSNVGAELGVFPQDLPYVSQGLDIEVHGINGKTAQGKIISISPIIDEDTRTVPVIALIENKSKEWKPGFYITADIKTAAEPADLVVPVDALQKIDNEQSLFIVKDQGFEIRHVKTGRSDGHRIEIVSGLHPGETYASTNTFLLKADHGKDEAQHMD